MGKLQKVVLKALQESGVDEDKSQLIDMLEHKVRVGSVLFFFSNISVLRFFFFLKKM